MKIELPTESTAAPLPVKRNEQSVYQATSRSAFTLLEVLIAMSIFFVAVFAILELTARGLRMARALQRMQVDISSIAAEVALTNRLEVGSASGDFGELYPEYTWTREIYEYSTNGLFQVDLAIYWSIEDRPQEYRTSILLFRPESVTTLSGGLR